MIIDRQKSPTTIATPICPLLISFISTDFQFFLSDFEKKKSLSFVPSQYRLLYESPRQASVVHITPGCVRKQPHKRHENRERFCCRYLRHKTSHVELKPKTPLLLYCIRSGNTQATLESLACLLAYALASVRLEFVCMSTYVFVSIASLCFNVWSLCLWSEHKHMQLYITRKYNLYYYIIICILYVLSAMYI